MICGWLVSADPLYTGVRCIPLLWWFVLSSLYTRMTNQSTPTGLISHIISPFSFKIRCVYCRMPFSWHRIIDNAQKGTYLDLSGTIPTTEYETDQASVFCWWSYSQFRAENMLLSHIGISSSPNTKFIHVCLKAQPPNLNIWITLFERVPPYCVCYFY